MLGRWHGTVKVLLYVMCVCMYAGIYGNVMYPFMWTYVTCVCLEYVCKLGSFISRADINGCNGRISIHNDGSLPVQLKGRHWSVNSVPD